MLGTGLLPIPRGRTANPIFRKPMNSTWTALRHPVFRRLWIATAISGTCVAVHDNAATYVLNSLSGNPALLSLLPFLTALPFFLFTLPAGILADRVNRKKLLCAINLWLAAGAFSLTIFNWLHILSSYLILACIFFIGIGFASNAPVATAVVAQLVPETELSSVATLNGLQFNISGILGPGRFAPPAHRSESDFHAERRLFPVRDSRSSAVERISAAFPSFLEITKSGPERRDPLHISDSRAAGCCGSESSVRVFHFRDPSRCSGHWAETTKLHFIRPWPLLHLHGNRFSVGSRAHTSAA
jgi:Transmembrane secretion effector